VVVTLKDVALQAGVSHTTVSLVLHGEKKISGKTREKVLATIEQMKYHPNYNARSLAKGKTNTIAIMASSFSSHFVMDIIKGIENESAETEFDLNQYSTRADKNKEIKQIKSIIYGRRADGIIMISLLPDEETLKEFKNSNTPVVFIERKIEGFSSIMTDNEQGGYLAAEQLIKSGRKNIGIIYGHLDCNDCLNAKERYTGFMQAMKDYGVTYDKSNSANTWYEFDDGINVCREMFERGARPDGIFCASGDLVALGFMKEASRLGIKIPSDLAIIGYDDILASSMVSPSLTTIRQPIMKMGQEAIDITIRTIKGEIKKPVNITFEPVLTVRESA